MSEIGFDMKKFALAAATGSVLGLLATTQIAGPLIAQEAEEAADQGETADGCRGFEQRHSGTALHAAAGRAGLRTA